LDGNTVRIAGDEKEFTCRLHGIDVPESDLVYGQAARESLADLVHGHDVHVHVINTVERNILGCRLLVHDKDISREQVRRGMAWKRRELTIDAQLLNAENNAKARGLGLWSEAEVALPAQ
jgi:endonuclease YncB( thermonuclease family)